MAAWLLCVEGGGGRGHTGQGRAAAAAPRAVPQPPLILTHAPAAALPPARPSTTCPIPSSKQARPRGRGQLILGLGLCSSGHAVDQPADVVCTRIQLGVRLGLQRSCFACLAGWAAGCDAVGDAVVGAWQVPAPGLSASACAQVPAAEREAVLPSVTGWNEDTEAAQRLVSRPIDLSIGTAACLLVPSCLGVKPPHLPTSACTPCMRNLEETYANQAGGTVSLGLCSSKCVSARPGAASGQPRAGPNRAVS